MPKNNYKLTIKYDGTDFCGWQSQSNGQSVQDKIESALKNNIYCIGENRVQELITKVTPYLTKPKSAEFHFIGHLQKNKVRKAMQYSDVIETVDSLKLAEKIESIMYRAGQASVVEYIRNKLQEDE